MKLSKSRKSSVWSISRKSTKTILTNENPGNISRLLDPKMTYDGRMTMATNNFSDEQSDSGISFYSTSMSSAGLKRIRRKSAHLEKFEVFVISICIISTIFLDHSCETQRVSDRKCVCYETLSCIVVSNHFFLSLWQQFDSRFAYREPLIYLTKN